MRKWMRVVFGVSSIGIVPALLAAAHEARAQVGSAAVISPPAARRVPSRALEGKRPDVVFVPTPQEVVDAMLDMAGLKKGDVLYDLGCGDGRIVVTAAKRYGVKAVGIDIDPARIAESLENVRKNGVGHLVTIRQADVFKTDLRGANVVTLYLLPTLNVRLLPQLSQLKPGSRVVSHSFAIKGVKPNRIVKVNTRDRGVRTVFLWVLPFENEPAVSVPPRRAAEPAGAPSR